LKKEPSKHMELAIHRVMKRRMAMVTADLKTEMHKIKLEREELIKEGKQMKSEKSEEKAEKAPVDTTEKQLRQHGVPMPDPPLPLPAEPAAVVSEGDCMPRRASPPGGSAQPGGSAAGQSGRATPRERPLPQEGSS